jgi:hypothetical protein
MVRPVFVIVKKYSYQRVYHKALYQRCFQFRLGQSFTTGLHCMHRITHYSNCVSSYHPPKQVPPQVGCRGCWCCPRLWDLYARPSYTEPSVTPLPHVMPSLCSVDLLPGIPYSVLVLHMDFATGLRLRLLAPFLGYRSKIASNFTSSRTRTVALSVGVWQLNR